VSSLTAVCAPADRTRHSAVTVDMLTTSAAIEVNRTVDRDGYVGLRGCEVLLDPPLEGRRVTLRFEGP
jgi:hypothetical protein